MIESGYAEASVVRRPGDLPTDRQQQFVFRNPSADDARTIFDLIESCPPLDTNSLYCNLLQCTHFADTCILAERNGDIRGWISGYRPTTDPDAMFVWQVAVHESARGQGLGLGLLNALFQLPATYDATRLITTVTPSNHASRRMFASFARQHGADIEVRPFFDSDRHFGGAHEGEELFIIGPLPTAQFAF